jgi:hypothetical protein
MSESARDNAVREAFDRISDSAARFLDQFPDWTVAQAWHAATLEEAFLYGVPNGNPPPRGIIGNLPIQSKP